MIASGPKGRNQVKTTVAAILFLASASANAADHCSLGLAKKFADGIIAVEVKENNYRPGRLIFQRSASHEYTVQYLNEQIRLMGERSAGRYIAYRQELEANPSLHIYNLQYKWKADDGLDLGFYYVVYTSNYDRGCTIKKLLND